LYLRSDAVHASVARGNNFKVVSQHCRYDFRKYYFTNRIIPIWNVTDRQTDRRTNDIRWQ